MTLIATEITKYVYTFGSIRYDLAARSYVMGILNVTPDSFSDGGVYAKPEHAIERALAMADEGADFVDVGGESTRPGSMPVPPEMELERVIPVIRGIVRERSVPVSIDTTKSVVADEALKAGATMVNDISGLTLDPGMMETVARHRSSVIIMHMKGTPKTMQADPSYRDVVGEVRSFLKRQAEAAVKAGISQVIVDPGIGFGKTLDHNLALLRNLGQLRTLGYPVLVGPSRKSFIGAVLDLPVDQRLEGTAAAVAACVLRGASIVRVHDVKEMKRVARMADALRTAP
ncbi:MAG: dihydropteroate synthase [Ignavibacteriales bacterium]|nr:dihydropteroate synthase [Ignavibacteriales bacterium]